MESKKWLEIILSVIKSRVALGFVVGIIMSAIGALLGVAPDTIKESYCGKPSAEVAPAAGVAAPSAQPEKAEAK